MEKYVVKGGNSISGKIRAESAKNAVLPILAATTLIEGKTVIEDCPKIVDVFSMLEILRSLGVKYSFENGNLTVDATDINSCEISAELSCKLRSSVFMMGALLSRFKKCKLFNSGGCDIGKRAIDLHIDGFKKIGATVEEKEDYVYAETDKIKGGSVNLTFPSVGATENIILASVFADGETVIKNAAKEPEIVCLIDFLNKAGARIFGAGTATIIIEGVEKLHGVSFKPIGDRIEAGTFLLLTAISGGEIEISNIKIKNILSLINKICNNTCKIKIKNDIIYFKSRGVGLATDISTGPFPDFPTDLQSQMIAYLSVARGKSIVCENVFERRFSHVNELVKMGAEIKVKNNQAFIDGVEKLHGEKVAAKDLRGGAGLVIAAHVAEGTTEIQGVSHIERGYADFHNKLKSVGVDIIKTL